MARTSEVFSANTNFCGKKIIAIWKASIEYIRACDVHYMRVAPHRFDVGAATIFSFLPKYITCDRMLVMYSVRCVRVGACLCVQCVQKVHPLMLNLCACFVQDRSASEKKSEKQHQLKLFDGFQKKKSMLSRPADLRFTNNPKSYLEEDKDRA